MTGDRRAVPGPVVPDRAHAGPAVKICGITDPAVGVAAVDAGADYLGLVFAGTVRRVTAARAREIVAAVGGRARLAGVFVDLDTDAVLALRDAVGFEIAQLHGGESPRACRTLRAAGLEVWKAVRPRSETELEHALATYAAEVDAILVEGYSADGPGGTGTAFPHEWLSSPGARSHDGPRLVLAGGLTPENVAASIARVEPDVVDVSSGVESAPGVKSIARMRAFIGGVRGGVGTRAKGEST